jgi:hypothetical protein
MGAEVAWLASGILSATAFLRGGRPHRPFTGDIDLASGQVTLGSEHRAFTRHHQRKTAKIEAALSAYLQGSGPAPKGKRLKYLVGEITKLRPEYQSMRARPLTSTESVAWGSSTPSTQALLAALYGSRGGRRSARRRKKARASSRPRKRGKKTRRAAGRARLVKGSAAARRHMARLRNMRKKKR